MTTPQPPSVPPPSLLHDHSTAISHRPLQVNSAPVSSLQPTSLAPSSIATKGVVRAETEQHQRSVKAGTATHHEDVTNDHSTTMTKALGSQWHNDDPGARASTVQRQAQHTVRLAEA
ncbi:unnamed protein product [Cyclocybe aegerita]|uniref:Uncharacterized protein n=1 Tax=Cyclocybe aegerita TaxID=1973307 RepID=A0A8S0W5K1_CYCAE|nr:unnamed protein product [Cyclocybe aegerita]